MPHAPSGSSPLIAPTEHLRPAQVMSADPAGVCEAAVIAAEFTDRLPTRLLAAISLIETGRMDAALHRLRPWPWAINVGGIGQFFASKPQAIAAVRALQARGIRSVDVGCLQVNIMFHPNAFPSLDAAFDPQTNATYAGRFLNALHAASREWAQAVAAYHSETPALGNAYRALVMDRWQVIRPLVQVRAAYQDFATDQAYAAFSPRSHVYAAFRTPLGGVASQRP